MKPINVFDYETLARERLDLPAWDFYNGGSEDEVTLRANRSALLIGRPVIWGLATAGQDGVRGVLEILRDELELAMMLAGCPTIESITQALTS